ncbi:MAG: 2-succinyl-5-enolpyruvyl-6-hydroxy-3-cyclohexene-1-carboxylic-acid synthase [Gammaproteobacteria bacterium]|nr:2-succinyl-5-enolpyruvyl-6-hydroxy-3-cyclohexene-1-carboxylic-acid synthase [Gammaproteobacteria bacterium]
MSNSAYKATALLVATLARLGLRHACLTPGSRSTPLSLAFAEHPDITDWIHHDERSSSFFALGLAKVTRMPVAVVTTSGTAAAELLPAAVEARYGTVPLLLITADRPPELRGIGAPQTIDQVGMFGDTVRRSADEVLTELSPGEITELAVTTWNEAARRPGGPVHLNLGFREPFVPTDLTVPQVDVPTGAPVRRTLDADSLGTAATMLSGRRTLIAAGPLDQPGFVDAVTALADETGWPILADPLSQLRAGPHDRSHVIATGDALFRKGRIPARPEAVLRFGAPPTSKAFTTWLEEHRSVPQVVVDEVGGRDPSRTARLMVTADPVEFAQALPVEPAAAGWTEAWTDADRNARDALAGMPFPSEPAVVQTMAERLPAHSNLYVASSMPVRDVDLFFPSIDRPVRMLANRGANGIDGLVSSGLGASAAGMTTFVLAGDLSALHDLGALATAARLRLPVTIVVVNNDGGGIFSFLPQSKLPRHFERVFSTPHGLSFVPVAEALGLRAVRVDRRDQFISALAEPGPLLIEVMTDRDANVQVHEEALAKISSPPVS